MRKHVRAIGLLLAAMLLMVLGLAAVRVRKRPPLWYYTQVSTSRQELPTRLVEPALKYVTHMDLPDNATDLRAIFEGGREPWIFVVFRTDVEGVEYVKRLFEGPGTLSEYLDVTALRDLKASGYQLFYNASRWQERAGVRVFDQESIESGLKISSGARPDLGRLQYWIFIDDLRNMVFISARLN